MKRNEVTREALENLGYVAMYRSRGCGVYSNNHAIPAQADRAFAAIVAAAHEGRKIRFERNRLLKEVHVHLDELEDNHRGVELSLYLCRPMTEAELAK